MESATTAADKLRRLLDLRVPISAADVARNIGICVYYVAISGPAAIWVPDQAMILINKRAWNGRRNFSCGHELAHALLHNGSPIYTDNSRMEQIEHEANAFSAALLMPEDDVRSSCATTDMGVGQLACYYRVSEKAMKIRLKELSIKIVNPSNVCPKYTEMKGCGC